MCESVGDRSIVGRRSNMRHACLKSVTVSSVDLSEVLFVLKGIVVKWSS